jgi:uncharacterized protein DUF5998
MSDRGSASGLRSAIERSGYYPALVGDSVDTAVAGERIVSYVVHQEPTFDRDELRRHVTVLVLTPSRLLVAHADEHPADDTSPTPYATCSSESVAISAITSVVVTRVVGDPASYRPGAPCREAMLTVGWGAVGRVDLEPAGCSDPSCEADHGYTGTVTADDLSVRVSEAADGAEAVSGALELAAALSTASAAARR